ncbi:hypothetical protein TNCV_3858591 [Trichonephila clavipes]|nr:hypothetical protein TNCV_3858591 [Trichonephila clavipes]
MARHLGNWSHLEVQAVIKLLCANNVSASAIHSQIVEVCGEDAMRSQVTKWCHSFQSDRQDVKNCNMAGSGQPSSSQYELKK